MTLKPIPSEYGEIFFSFLSVYDPGGIIRKRQSHVTLMVNFKVPG
jgi:hypothetical protein